MILEFGDEVAEGLREIIDAFEEVTRLQLHVGVFTVAAHEESVELLRDARSAALSARMPARDPNTTRNLSAPGISTSSGDALGDELPAMPWHALALLGPALAVAPRFR